MLPTEELFVYVYVLIHDLVLAGAIRIPRRPGPAPACTDAELLAIAQVRHLWFYGFRLAARTDLGSRIVRAWAIVAAAVSERDVAAGLPFWGLLTRTAATIAAHTLRLACLSHD
ncbi:MAG TPA: hypothetical protein VF070_36560 [Streptosporangiaceae bacterium]